VDKLTAEQRSRNMAAIRSHDTKPEKVVRSLLHSLGLRFRLHQRALPGSPDIVLKRHSAVVFVHGCFWHAHDCGRGKIPKTRRGFWSAKFESNRKRDVRQAKELKALGWRVLTIWECETNNEAKLSRRLARWFNVALI
jgi:DNA mismatch endonuclease, patch repair protein